MRHSGQVIWFSQAKGYGILACELENDVFFDAKASSKGKRPPMQVGDPVSFEIVNGETGPEAKAVIWRTPASKSLDRL